MQKIKHSKYKNPHLIYEFLVRQVTSDIMNNIPIVESKAMKIIKRNFSKGVLKEELDIYNALLSVNAKNRHQAEFLISECSSLFKKLNEDALKKRKYHVIKEIRQNYDLEKLFESKIWNYKESASVYLFLESVKNNDIINKSNYREYLVENLVTEKRDIQPLRLNESFRGYTKEDIKLAYHILLNNYNRKFGSVLNENQANFIRDYVSSSELDTKWYKRHLGDIRTTIVEQQRLISKSDIVLSLKLKECISFLSRLENKSKLNENDYHTILNFYQLTEDIKTVLSS